MNNNIKRALQYIANTGGNCPLDAFLEDHEPIGEWLLDDMRSHPDRLWTYNSSGNMVLTEEGRIALSDSKGASTNPGGD